MATTTVPADKPAETKPSGPPAEMQVVRRGPGRPPNPTAEEKAAKEAEDALLHTPSATDPLRPLSPPQPSPVSLDMLKTQPREMLPPEAVAAAAVGKSRHADREPNLVAIPAPNFVKPETAKEREDEDEAVRAAFDYRNPVPAITWTDEEGSVDLVERRRLRREAARPKLKEEVEKAVAVARNRD